MLKTYYSKCIYPNKIYRENAKQYFMNLSMPMLCVWHSATCYVHTVPRLASLGPRQTIPYCCSMGLAPFSKFRVSITGLAPINKGRLNDWLEAIFFLLMITILGPQTDKRSRNFLGRLATAYFAHMEVEAPHAQVCRCTADHTIASQTVQCTNEAQNRS